MQPKNTTKSFIGYREIKLKLYIELVETSEYRKLLILGNATNEECADAWEQIVSQNDRVAGGYKYLNYLHLIKDYGTMLSQYLAIKATLTTLQFRVDEDDIDWLKRLGYLIKVDGSTDAYTESIRRADQRARNLLTRMGLKLNELEAGRERSDAVPSSFDYVMANISESLGREISDDITLARYNEYCKLARLKIDVKKKQNATTQYGG